MTGRPAGVLLHLLRALSLAVAAVVATTALTWYAPGLFSDAREMDAQHSTTAIQQMLSEQRHASLSALLAQQWGDWRQGSLGRSRQFDLPVASLLRQRGAGSLRTLAAGLGGGWLVALTAALVFSARRTSAGETLISAPLALLLSVPVGVMAVVCLATNWGGPVVVLVTLVAVRDFKLLYRLLRRGWRAPHLHFARALGVSRRSMARHHLLPLLSGEFGSVLLTSLIVSMSLLVPIEVIFDTPGLGQLAWSAAMNRDLPVLTAVTALLALAVGLAGCFAPAGRAAEEAQWA